jgi:pterin-4a-carbinolamine dehydratase
MNLKITRKPGSLWQRLMKTQSDRSNHHPKWQNTWNRVEFGYVLINIEYRLSQRDIKLARILEEIWGEFAEN